jgi:hypothetical protein
VARLGIAYLRLSTLMPAGMFAKTSSSMSSHVMALFCEVSSLSILSPTSRHRITSEQLTSRFTYSRRGHRERWRIVETRWRKDCTDRTTRRQPLRPNRVIYHI